MSFFQLPQIPIRRDISGLFSFDFSDNNCTEPIINKTLMTYLTRIKSSIDHRQNEWDKYKKYTNPYEYIHTIVPQTNQSVCKLNPLSRSYFKMIEIYETFDLDSMLPLNCNTFHIAEGPGGFIEALCHIRKNDNDRYKGMTLINSKQCVPGWKKSSAFLKKHNNIVSLEFGVTGDGDIMSSENLKYCFDKYHGTMDLVTGDGGFDFSIDFNHQETRGANLIFCQIALAIATQKKDGCFILKIFDTFTQGTVQMIYLLSILYEHVYFVKPKTSRCANSEKYVVCKGFRLDDTSNLIIKFIECYDRLCQFSSISKLFDFEIPYFYCCKLQEINAIFGQQQIENISNTISLIDSNNYDRLESMKRNQIEKCIVWCKDYKLPYNTIFNTNSFLSEK